MHRKLLTAAAAVALLAASPSGFAPREPVSDAYFGATVVDAYRYMEHTDDPRYVAWLGVEAARTSAMLATLPDRPAVEAAARASVTPPTIDGIVTAAGTAFYTRSGPKGPSLYARPLAGGAERLLVHAPGENGAPSLIDTGGIAPSPDGRLLAFHVITRGNDVSDIRIVRTSDGRETEVPLRGTVFDDVGWLGDRAVTYDMAGAHGQNASQDAVFGNSKAMLHVLGTAQSADRVLLAAGGDSQVDVPHGAFVFVDAPLDSRWAIAEVRDTSNRGSRFYAAEQAVLAKGGPPRWRPLGGADDAFTDYAVRGDEIDLATSRNAPNYRVVRASLAGAFAPVDVVPASDHAVVSGTLDLIPKIGIFALNAAKDADYVQLLDGGAGRVVRVPWGAAPAVSEVPSPLRGSVVSIVTDQRRDGALLQLTSWTDPGDVYAYAPGAAAAVATGWERDAAFTAQLRVAEELAATAADGAQVPLSVVHAPGIALDGTHPVLLEAIGAYGFSRTPAYTVVPDAWLRLGGIYAVAHVRGGGELGEAWRAAGRGVHKANTWNDLIACAQLLIAKGYSSPRRIGLYGPAASYLGGEGASVAIGRAIETKPALFSAAVVDAPAFDLLRAEQTFTGKESVDEFGSVANADGFNALFAMSPYAHVAADTRYPPLLARSYAKLGIGDDWQAAKMVAALQAAGGSLDAAYFNDAGSEGVAARRVDLYAFLLAHATGS
jgi:prolyl oligopeptidase